MSTRIVSKREVSGVKGEGRTQQWREGEATTMAKEIGDGAKREGWGRGASNASGRLRPEGLRGEIEIARVEREQVVEREQ